MKIWNKITNEPWATTSDTLENIINIAKGKMPTRQPSQLNWEENCKIPTPFP